MPVEHHQRRNNKINRGRIDMLQRRLDFLQNRVGSEASERYDDSEIAALRWAIRICREWMKDDPHWVFIPSPSGEGGRWRHLNEAYEDTERGGWFIQVDRETERPATDQEIREAQEFVRIKST